MTNKQEKDHALETRVPAVCEFCTNPMPDTDGHGLGECVPVCDRCDGSGVDPGPRCESCGTTGDTVRTGDDVDLCEKCAKDIAEPESPAEPAQDDEDAISSVSAQTFDVAGENGAALRVRRIWHELARRLAREKADLRAKLAAAEQETKRLRSALRIADDIIVRGDDPSGNEPEDVCQIIESFVVVRAKLADAHEQLRCPDCGCATPEEAEAGECGCDSPVCSVEVTTTVAKELCDVAKKLAAAEARIAMRDRAVLKLIHNSTGSVVGMGTMLLKDDSGYFEVRWSRGVIEDVVIG